MSSNDNVPVLTVADIANRWRCGRRAVLAKIHNGDLRSFRVGRSWRIALAELERFEREAKAA